MADEWKYKDLPRAANGVAPAKWDEELKEWVVYTGVNDVKAVGVEDRLTAIENKLDSVIQNGSVNTQVIGSNVAQPTDLQYHDLNDENPLPIRTIGGFIKTETVLKQEVRSSNKTNLVLTPPDGAKGLLLSAKAYSKTGNFKEGEGFAIDAGILPINYMGQGFGRIFTVTTDYTTDTHNFGHASILFYPGANIGDAVIAYGANKIIGIPPFPLIRTDLLIKGTFSEGEGIDCEMIATWLV